MSSLRALAKFGHVGLGVDEALDDPHSQCILEYRATLSDLIGQTWAHMSTDSEQLLELRLREHNKLGDLDFFDALFWVEFHHVRAKFLRAFHHVTQQASSQIGRLDTLIRSIAPMRTDLVSWTVLKGFIAGTSVSVATLELAEHHLQRSQAGVLPDLNSVWPFLAVLSSMHINRLVRFESITFSTTCFNQPDASRDSVLRRYSFKPNFFELEGTPKPRLTVSERFFSSLEEEPPTPLTPRTGCPTRMQHQMLKPYLGGLIEAYHILREE